MTDEIFLSGYCRMMDSARAVLVDVVEGAADCFWPDCPHRAECQIAKQIEACLGQADTVTSNRTYNMKKDEKIEKNSVKFFKKC